MVCFETPKSTPELWVHVIVDSYESFEVAFSL